MSHKAELKENLLATQLERALIWTIERRVQVLTILGILVAAVLIGSVFLLRQQETREQARTKLAYVQALVSQQRFAEAEPVLLEVRKVSLGDDASRLAAYLGGVVAFGQSKFDEAIANFTQAADLSSNHPIHPLALANLGSAHEQKKDYEAAAGAYSAFAAKHADHFLAPRVQLALGRTQFLAGKNDDARKSLEQLIDLYPTSEWAENARRLIDKNRTR